MYCPLGIIVITYNAVSVVGGGGLIEDLRFVDIMSVK